MTQKVQFVAHAVFSAFINTYHVALRVQETLPGPLVKIFGRVLASERWAFDLLSPVVKKVQMPFSSRAEVVMVEDFKSMIHWNPEEQLCIQAFIDKLIQSPSSLRELEYGGDFAQHFLKGSLTKVPVAPLIAKCTKGSSGNNF